jgi:serine/threonine protein kinase/DNA polymerase III delta prime subunit
MPEAYIERYQLIRKISVGKQNTGAPDLWLASDAGDIFYLKVWNRPSDESHAIRAMWNREIRGLMRLQGYPGASEIFIRLRDMGITSSHYFVVLEGGRRMLLSEVLAKRNEFSWLQNLGEIGRRRPLWEGLLRIAQALSILHREGTLHRSLSPASIFVSPDGQGDFRLSGFEWSLRLSGLGGASAKVMEANSGLKAPELDREEGEYSTGTDWFDFGMLAAELVGAPVKASFDRATLRAAIKKLSTIRSKEKDLILGLIEEDPQTRHSNGEAILQVVRDITRDLSAATAGSGRKLVLALRISDALRQTIQKVSQQSAVAADLLKQREWVRHDLRGDVRVIARGGPSPHYILKGEKLEYRVRQWTVQSSSTWDIGYCESIEANPRSAADDQYFTLGDRQLDIILYSEVHKSHKLIRDRAAPWDRIFTFRKEKVRLEPHLREVHDFFRVTQGLDTALTIAQICPVKVLDTRRTSSDTIVDVTPFEEPDRTKLARYLSLQSPADQIKDWFGLGVEAISADDDEDPKSDRYSFLDQRTIGSDSTGVTWRFVRATQAKSGPVYTFRTQVPVSLKEGKLYLARNHGGTLKQIRRRHKAIEEMRHHEDLLRLIAGPKEVSRRSSEQLPKGTVDIELDPSKMMALERLWDTHPSFALQGPPGTGKTTLIQAFADRLFTADNSAQILITAHSHHTVDDVRNKLAKLFEKWKPVNRPIILRLGANDPTLHDVEPVTEGILNLLSVSELAAKSPAHMRARIALAVTGAKGAEAEGDVRTMQAIVQDAANVTLSTSNSAELADLASRGRRFDWSIIEEAGKAHGFDMAIALQESHRLLLIGDHHQLPPYNARLYKDLLSSPLAVQKALQTGEGFASGLIDSSLTEEEDGLPSLEERCSRWRRMVALFAEIFEKSIDIEREFDESDEDLGPAATLTNQHRMHPHIAELVGKIFYQNSFGGTILQSPIETHEKFAGEPPFDISPDSWLPRQRIVWGDVPWIQRKQYSAGEISGLFVSMPEVDLIVKILGQIRTHNGKPCELQILSPYNDQLVAIRRAIEAEFKSGRLSHMQKEPFTLSYETRMGATVDQFQGSEADIVIVSLVRNNALVPWKSIGFLKEPNRMNVLLSRARHKLIIVGSWDFFDSRCDEFTGEDQEYAYIGRMMNCMKEAERDNKLKRTAIKR